MGLNIEYVLFAKSSLDIRLDYAWGGVRLQKDIDKEVELIQGELEKIKEMLPFETSFEYGGIVRTDNDILKLSRPMKKKDALIVFGISDGPYYSVTCYGVPVILFIKQYTGELFYNTLHALPFVSKLRELGESHLAKLITDDLSKVAKELVSIHAAKSIRENRILCVGPPSVPHTVPNGYRAMRIVKEKFGVNVTFMTYEDFSEKFNGIKDVEAKPIADDFLSGALEVKKTTFNETLLAAKVYLALKEALEEENCNALTVNCLVGSLPIVNSAPCLALSKLCDEGIVSACEGDFPGLLSQMVLAYVSNKPCFFDDPTIHPGENTLILAHCTAPTKMKGYDKPPEPYIAVTHHGGHSATLQVKFSKDIEVTVAGLAHDSSRCVITEGVVTRCTDYPICRSQLEIKVKNAKALLDSFVGLHYSMVYGKYAQEAKRVCELFDVESVLL